MQKSVLLFTVLALVAQMATAQNQDYLDYIEKYKDIAIREMERAGVPASIKLAQALLESGAGKSDLARRANNHFGIKCGGDWDDKTFYKKDDDYDKNGRLIKSCFRSYRNPEASFIAHSEFLLNPAKFERYGFLFRLDPTDYKGWARGLRSAGYATDPRYAKRLISLIERYDLQKYDQMLPVGKSEHIVEEEVFTGEEITNAYMINNDVKYVLAFNDEKLAAIAERTSTPVDKLLEYNEELRSADQMLPEGRKVYIQPKRNSYRGKQVWHYVEAGEKMADISNRYAVKLSKLYERNAMKIGQQPKAKERIKLRGGDLDQPPKLVSALAQTKPEKPGFLFDGMEEEAFLDTMKVETDQPPKNKPTKPVAETQENALDAVSSSRQEDEPTVPVVPVSDVTWEDTGTDDLTLEPEFVDDIFDAPKPEKEQNANATSYLLHTVVQGDTLWNISQRYGTTVDAVKKLNGLNSNNIRLGMQLKVK